MKIYEYDMRLFRKLSVGLLAGLVFVLGMCFITHVEQASADTTTQSCNAMYRLYNPYSGEHFYTASYKEKSSLTNIGWKDEGIGWYAPTSSNTPVYRLYNKYAPGGDHHYTMSKDERDNLVKLGWTAEGTGWYSDDAKSIPLYRQYNPYAQVGTHNYTTSKDENDKLASVGWKAEGIAWYGVEHNSHTYYPIHFAAETHTEPIYVDMLKAHVYCGVHETEQLTREEFEAKNASENWKSYCSSDPLCDCHSTKIKYTTTKTKVGTRTVVDKEAEDKYCCIECGKVSMFPL